MSVKIISNNITNLSSILLVNNFTNQTTTTIKNEYESGDPEHFPIVARVILSILILLIDLVGNSIVVLIVVKKRRMQTFTNWLILNLAVADLSVGFGILLEIPLDLKQNLWIYGKAFCPIFYPVQTSVVYGSVFTLVALSFSRYWAIIHPFKKQPTVAVAKVLIGIIWVCSIVVTIPYMLILEYDPKTGKCEEHWTNSQRRIYTIAIFIFQYCLPLIVITIAYVFIVYDLCFKEKNTVLPVDKSKRSDTKKVIKLLLIITITFAVSILPYHLVALFYEFGNQFKYINDVNTASLYMLYTNSALNPIIYNVFNSTFRESFMELYKTIAACVCSREEDLHGTGFFSSRRPSMYETVRKWSKSSLNRPLVDQDSIVSPGNEEVSLQGTKLVSANPIQRTPMHLTADYRASSNITGVAENKETLHENVSKENGYC